MQPFYMLNKAGFLNEVRMRLQLSLIENDRIGVSALMQTTEDRDSARIAIVNVATGFTFSGCSRQIFDEFFSLTINSPAQLRHHRLSSILPIIPLLINKYGSSFFQAKQNAPNQSSSNSMNEIEVKSPKSSR